ncbi:hypothetical protein DUI87_09130 [Hirundo rustica rustica]|uniref:Uncharacterized protein n=1 Tax=Hirundo rustica rustica TaxID=333673 RepID=A0A3M0KLW0_HIRRU|nr:hypothetical protein DUI87_09130 [Hirundo rustica rustica]
MPDCSKMDPSLTKVKPIKDGSNASVIIHLRKKKMKSHCAEVIQHPEKRGPRICKRNNFVDTKDSEEGEEEGFSGTRAEISLQIMVKKLYPCSSWMSMRRRPTPGQMDAQKKAVVP